VNTDIERETDDPQLACSGSPGAQFMYADLPRRPPARQYASTEGAILDRGLYDHFGQERSTRSELSSAYPN